MQQLLDLVAFLKGQTTSAGGHEHHMSHDTGHETTAGDYVIRLVYVPRERTGHVLVFVTDKETGEAIPYLPVTLTLRTERSKPRIVRLAPMMGADGFHYGADATIPDETEQVRVSIGRPTMKVMASAKGASTSSRYARASSRSSATGMQLSSSGGKSAATSPSPRNTALSIKCLPKSPGMMPGRTDLIVDFEPRDMRLSSMLPERSVIRVSMRP